MDCCLPIFREKQERFFLGLLEMKKRRDPRPYVGIHKEVIFKCQEWTELSPPAKCLYLMMKGKYNPGKNHATVKLTYREIKKIGYTGLKKNETIARCFRELESSGWIRKKGPGGGLYRKATFYKITGKYDEYGL
jgi:hypothetical protein